MILEQRYEAGAKLSTFTLLVSNLVPALEVGFPPATFISFFRIIDSIGAVKSLDFAFDGVPYLGAILMGIEVEVLSFGHIIHWNRFLEHSDVGAFDSLAEPFEWSI